LPGPQCSIAQEGCVGAETYVILLDVCGVVAVVAVVWCRECKVGLRAGWIAIPSEGSDRDQSGADKKEEVGSKVEHFRAEFEGLNSSPKVVQAASSSAQSDTVVEMWKPSSHLRSQALLARGSEICDNACSGPTTGGRLSSASSS
jgi:hypothetical protein